MPQVVAHGREFGAAIQKAGRMGVPCLMRGGSPQLFGQRGAAIFDDISGGRKEVLLR